jgi:Uma2 family endonuclease
LFAKPKALPNDAMTPPATADAVPAASETAQLRSVSEDGRLISEEEYWRDYYDESDIHYEWNNGRLEEKPVSDYGTYLVYLWFVELLKRFLDTHPVARLVGLEMGFRLPLPSRTVIRKPDLGVVRTDNPCPLGLEDASYRGIFDLCVEALSDKERQGIERDAVVKKAEYEAGGVREYYILHRKPRHQAFYTRNDAGLYVPIEPDGGVIRSRVLPGFRFRQSDLLDQPALDVLRDDPVYADFVLPGWRAAEQHAEQQEQARRAAEQRADQQEQARHRAEQRTRELERQLARLKAAMEGRDGD